MTAHADDDRIDTRRTDDRNGSADYFGLIFQRIDILRGEVSAVREIAASTETKIGMHIAGAHDREVDRNKRFEDIERVQKETSEILVTVRNIWDFTQKFAVALPVITGLAFLVYKATKWAVKFFCT